MKQAQKISLSNHGLVKLLVVVGCTLLPWNAKAINQGNLPDKLFTNTVNRDLVEKLLVESLMQIARGETKKAMDTVDELIRTTPNFKLAHLIRGDLLSAQEQTINPFGHTAAISAAEKSKEIEGLREEARARLNYYFSTDNQRQVPNIAVQMNAKQTHLILIDTVKSRLFVYKKTNTGLQHVADYYVTIGKNGAYKNVEGDKRTPIGLYFASKKLTTPLSDFYGEGAYPLNYPNALDKHYKKTGHGIWLHGTPKDTYSRPPRASDGTLSEWADHKRRVQAGKPKVAIKISDISMFGYPILRKSNNLSPNTKVIVVDFDQYYESPTLKNKMRKRQYWTNENNQWKIIYEGAA